MTDPIADMLTRIRNAAAVGRTEVTVRHSSLKEAITKVLVAEGYLAKAATKDGELHLTVATENGVAKVGGLKRISKPGRRIYAGADELPRVRRGLGAAVISTSKGVMSAAEARKQRLGGEVLVEVF